MFLLAPSVDGNLDLDAVNDVPAFIVLRVAFLDLSRSLSSCDHSKPRRPSWAATSVLEQRNFAEHAERFVHGLRPFFLPVSSVWTGDLSSGHL